MADFTSLSRHLERAESAARAGRSDDAIRILQHAAAEASADTDSGSAEMRLHGDVCRRLAELLRKADRLPEAMQALQEAADCYGRAPGAESEASECAREIVSGVKEMWGRPDRLYLLIARIDRERRQLEARPGTESEQADLVFKSATILQRRDRFEDGATRYQEALALYGRAEDSELKLALTHQRLAGLYQYELGDPRRAVEHYREAIRLYAAHEPPVDGEQMNRALCDGLLRNLLAQRMVEE